MPIGRVSGADLRYVVIDEMHTYRGVFGSHVANVIRRMKRVAQFLWIITSIHLYYSHYWQPN